MLKRRDTYASLYRDFRWDIPERFNIGVAVSDRWAAVDPTRVAIYDHGADARPETLTFGELSESSNAFANALASLGVRAGDRVALLLPQGFETVIAHVAIYKLGAIAVPLALLFGVDALEFRLRFAGCAAIVTNGRGGDAIAAIRDRLPDLRHVVFIDDVDGQTSFRDHIEAQPTRFEAVDSTPDDPALMIFTSGTTGPPKGALHGHRVLLGHLPGFEMAYQFPPETGDVMWTPADWAWAGGLLNALFPALYLGIPVVAGRFERFSPRGAFQLMQDRRVSLAFLPPTALRMLRAADVRAGHFDLKLRAIMSAGEQLGRDTYEWARAEFGFPVNELYGQTECNLVLGSSAAIGASKAGATGLQVPGHRVAVIDDRGSEVATGTVGQIAVRRPDPVMFLGYWRDDEATAKKFVGDWMLTGDQGSVDADGYFHFFGRDDDVITSAGYRIGPGEIEDCLASHPAVAGVAAVGKPDATRTEIVKAYVVARPGAGAGDTLARELQAWVRERLSAHEYPREIEFVDDVPLTTSGKVIRRIFRERAAAEASAAQQ